MKPDPHRLIRASYPLSVIVPTRFRDLDTLGHLNNVALGSFYEEGRAHLNRAAFPQEMRHESGLRMLIADVHIAYLAEAFYPGDIEVAAGISHIGRSSYTIALALFQKAQCVGTCETVLVVTDGTGAMPIPPAQRAALEGLMVQAG
ncbi:acyl-CoA thioesterase [Alkalicaulis satelles]|uniref:Acyl-CoA thioesterase n=1 Tax=Alkalicaulis satelles TaxID=2609175 RepID=A0A5M6ZG18_9PROT|nr:acyl-CoA thioesterase [Alkalicaulis satelles]KAA5803669.1 acyl-CoA thioesterase [Alkalicaulis satelles]